MNNIKIKVAENAGFCFGVERAIRLVENALENNKTQVYCWGDLIHNPAMIKNLEQKGLKIINNLKNFKENSVFIVRSHGITLEDLNLIKEKTCNIIDTTCPFVKKAQDCAENFEKQEFQVIVVGDKDHVEVKSINSRTKNQAFIVNNLKDLDKIKNKLFTKVGVVCQTTQKNSKLEKIIAGLKKIKVDFEIQNTICSDATKKQKAVSELGNGIDLIIVIGGLHSSNTTKLAEIGRSKKIKTFHIERAEDISQGWFFNNAKVFLTAGASTHPNEIIEAEKIIKNFDF